jgi:hypothetical protein
MGAMGGGHREGLTAHVRRAFGSEAGSMLLEVLIAGVMLGIATVGVALMFSLGGTWVTAKGDDRVGLWLAQQKIEQLRALTFTCIPVGGPGGAGQVFGPAPTCTASTVYNEPQWTATEGVLAPAPSDRTFARLTCVQYVSDTDFSSPAYTGGLAAAPCPTVAAPLTAPTNTKRITVVVTPAQREADPTVMQAWISSVGP